jgi:hypothetical protein
VRYYLSRKKIMKDTLPLDSTHQSSAHMLEEDIRWLAQKIKSSPLALPLAIVIEAHLPLRGCLVAFFELSAPIIGLFLPDRAFQTINKLCAAGGERDFEELWHRFLEHLTDGN